MSLHEYRSSQGVMVYEKRGLGDPVICIHGIYPGASHLEYESNISILQQSATVYAINLIGFGQSDVPRISHTAQMHQHLVRDFITDVIGGPAHVIASGVSCGIAARLGVYDDPLVRSLVLLSPIIKSTYKEIPGLADRLTHFFLGKLAAGYSIYEVDASDEGLWNWIKENYHDPKRAAREKLKQLSVEANEPNKMMAHISLLCGYFDTDLSNWLPYVRSPVLILMGVDLMPVPPESWFRRAQWSKEKHLELIDGAKSFPHQEQSGLVHRLIDDFFRKIG